MTDIRESEGRNRFGSARERDRRKARREIRARVANATIPQEDSTLITEEEDLVEEQELPSSMTLSDQEMEFVSQILRHVEAGKVAAFSLTTLSKHFELLNKPIPVALLSSFKIKTLCISRFGIEYAQLIQNYVEATETCTLIEYAVWLGEYRLLGPLISGGLDPTLRGQLKEEVDGFTNESTRARRRLVLSSQIMKRFFDSFPGSLSSYIVKRVVDMRLEHWNKQSDHKTCALCSSSKSPAMLAFGSPCHDCFCEDCFWQDMLNNIDSRTDGNVVVCPVCGASCASEESNNTVIEELRESPLKRCQESLTKFQALPANQNELKKLPRRRKTRQRALSSSWSEAVLQSIGSSQDIRNDKFFSFTERGNYYFVRGCLVGGVDVNATNEYGQTCLHVAAWRGHTDIVKLLLHFGANPFIMANGGISAEDSAESEGYGEIVQLLREHSLEESPSNGNSSRHLKNIIEKNDEAPSPTLEVVIDEDSDHPGAGSYLIDDGFSSSSIDTLIQLWQSLPVVQFDRRKKKGSTAPCSVRSYYCDSLQYISCLLTYIIFKAFETRSSVLEQVLVFPHMRFLHYAHPGSVLAPHVDLPRTDISGNHSTHTFILYLFDCDSGGETSLLAAESGDGREVTLARVSPRKGRLLLFPHACPHEGNLVIDVPKVLVRGEILLTRA